jgi:hypothetical protein
MAGWLFVEALRTVRLGHRDLARSQHSPERYGCCFRRGQGGLGHNPPLELFVQGFNRIRRKDWLFGSSVQANSLSLVSFSAICQATPCVSSRSPASAAHFRRKTPIPASCVHSLRFPDLRLLGHRGVRKFAVVTIRNSTRSRDELTPRRSFTGPAVIRLARALISSVLAGIAVSGPGHRPGNPLRFPSCAFSGIWFARHGHGRSCMNVTPTFTIRDSLQKWRRRWRPIVIPSQPFRTG